MATASPLEQARRARLQSAVSLDRGTALWASSQNTSNRPPEPEEPVLPPLPQETTNREWSPFDGADDLSLPAPVQEEEEGGDLLVDPLTGESMDEEESVGFQGQNAPSPLERLRSAQASDALAFSLTGGSLEGAGQGQLEQELQGFARKELKAGLTRGVAYVAEVVLDACDIGSFGVAILVDFILHFFTLGFLNLQMVYGSWIAKGESTFIGPLEWSPIPLDGILPVMFLHATILFLDLCIIFITGIVGLSVIFFIYAQYLFITDPIGFGTDLVNGTGIFGPLHSVFGFIFGL